MTGRRVLVVDDSDLARALLARTLARAGFEVIEARDGVEGALAALRDSPHAIVTDLEMPTMDGYQLVRLLKSDEAARRIPVLILTSHTEATSRFWGLRTGAEAFLTKDRPEEIAAQVERIALPAEFRFPAPSSLPSGAMDILARVASQLDASLLEATVVNTLLERGISSGDFGKTCSAALGLVAEIVDAPLLALGTADARATELYVLAHDSVARSQVEELERRVVESLGGAASTDALITVESLPGECRARPDLERRVAVSLPVRDAVASLQFVPSDADRYAAGTHRLVAAVVKHLALLIDNARLAARLLELSTHDGLTGLFNHRAALELLESEMSRARRYGQALSIVLCDIDHFKQVNDLHGHLAGDEGLRMTARALKDALRTTDAVGRYGGEEFLAILPHSGLDAARITAERLRRSVAAKVVELPGGKQAHLTASFGVAAFAEVAADASADHLVALADARMYEAKSAGRNRVRP